MPIGQNTSEGTIGALTPSAGNFPANHAYYVREFIEIANPELVFEMFGTPKDIDPNSSNKIVFNKVLKLETLEDFPLNEGVSPPDQQLTLVRLEKTINQYGGAVKTTDRLHEESINGLTSEFNKRVAEQGGETMNRVVRDDLTGGGNVRYAGGVAERNDITAPGVNVADFEYMFKSFKLFKVKSVRPMTTGSPNTETAPTAESYAVIIPVEACSLVEALDDSNGNAFRNVEKYAGQRAVWANEYGCFKQFAFILNTEVDIVSNAAGTPQDIAKALVFGKGAYHYTRIGASDVEIFIKAIGSSGSLDPINQRASIGWKAKKGAVIVQPTYMFRYEFSVGATA